MGTEEGPVVFKVFVEKGEFGDDEEETDGAGYKVRDTVEEKELEGLLVRDYEQDGRRSLR